MAGDRRGTEGWHLKKEVSVGHLLTTITIAMSAVGYIIQNEKAHEQHRIRIDMIQTILVDLKSSDIRQDAKMEAAVTRIEQKLNRWEDKFDGLLASIRSVKRADR